MSAVTNSKTVVLATLSKSAAPLRKQVLDELRQAIISGRLEPGARLVERTLIEMLGVSRTVLREAFRQLESEGLITVVPNKGPVVRDLTFLEAKELYAIRAVLEGLAARLFVENADNTRFEQLSKALDLTIKAYRSGNPQRVLRLKNGFYDVLFTGAGSATLSLMLDSLHARIWRWRALGLSHPRRSPRRSAESVKSLNDLLLAIQARKANVAEKLMRDEADKAFSEVIRLLAEDRNANETKSSRGSRTAEYPNTV
jgi:GntR family transcriptional regulator, trigonelline degradation regulator